MEWPLQEKKELVMGVQFLQLLVLFLKADWKNIKITSVGELHQAFTPREAQSGNLMQKWELDQAHSTCLCLFTKRMEHHY